MVQRMRAAQEAMESETKEEEFYLKALLVRSISLSLHLSASASIPLSLHLS